MKNAEKYVSQIAKVITSNVDGICSCFNDLMLNDCSDCLIHGYCNDEKKMKDWLLSETDE